MSLEGAVLYIVCFLDICVCINDNAGGNSLEEAFEQVTTHFNIATSCSSNYYDKNRKKI